MSDADRGDDVRTSIQNHKAKSGAADQGHFQAPRGVAISDVSPRQHQLKEFGALAASSSRVQQLRALSVQANQSPRTVEPRKLTQLCQPKQVVQRLVPHGLGKDTPVVIKRSTSSEFHGALAKIVDSGPGPNEYIVSVGDQLLIARLDQLLPSGQVPKAIGAEVEIDIIVRTPPDQLLTQVLQHVKNKLSVEGPVVLGGSFAALIHALAAGQNARTPRDIDVFVDPKDGKKLGLSYKPILRADIPIWGIPLELHRAGDLVSVDEGERDAGIVNKNKLLAKALIKVRKQQYKLKAAIPDPGVRQDYDARAVLGEMEQASEKLMAMNDEVDSMSDTSKEVWLKTLVDIKSLVNSGADLSVYNQKK
jgi:hypothetical protein